jgi:DNA mismatch repair protein MutS
MVEMEETANILRYATDRSLLILDEIGRGTSTYDGLSIAWAIVEFLHESVKARTLFATHYHELIELGNSLPAAHNYHFSVREQGEKIIFMHHLLEGGVSRSYGIKVARLAGLPKSVIQRAEVVLKLLEAQRQLNTPEVSNQLPLFDKSSPEKNRSEESMPRLEKALKDLHVETLTPLEALNLLAQWKHEMLADDDQDPH